MSNYLLYGNKLIENDNTIKDFAKSLINGLYTEDLNKNDFKDELINLVIDSLSDDISRTDVNYEELMYKYRSEIGDILYEVENHGCDMPLIKFFGKEAEDSFNFIIKEYIDIHFEELIGE